jgi:hypothetical protein
LAWDSPAKASFRHCSVREPLSAAMVNLLELETIALTDLSKTLELYMAATVTSN